MDGPLTLPGPLRPVPVYCRRPMDLEPSSGLLLSTPRMQASSGSSQKVKDATLPPASFPNPSLLSSLHPPRSELMGKGENLSSFNKTREWSLPNKSGVPIITPVRGPDLRSVALYQSLLRHHPAYHQLLETFLLPPLPPLLCPPPAALCDTPFAAAYCTSAPLPGPATSVGEEERRRAQARSEAERSEKESSMSHESVRNEEDVFAGERKGFRESRHHSTDDPREERCRESHSVKTDEKPHPGNVLTTEELVSSITAVPDPYQQYGYGRKLFPCPQCRYTTDRRNNLKRHMLTMHQLSAKLLECCGLLFRTKAALREHALIFHYHGYTCFYCARRFCRKALLKRHLSVHNGQKEFLCNVCDYATSHKSNLERHRRVHMRQDDEISCEDGAPSEGRRETMDHLSEDEISVCSHDEEGEEIINVHSD